MLLSSKQKIVILVALSSISLYSGCGMKKSNDTNTQQQDVPVPVPGPPIPVPTPTNPTVSLSATEPKSLLYVDSSASSSLSSGSANLKGIVSGNLYQAVGNGGLGADLNTSDSLTAYPGVPVSATLTDIPSTTAVSINVIATGDAACANAFSYNANAKQVEVDSSKITTLAFCNVEVDGSAALKDKNYTGKTSFKIALNPTMKSYFSSGDIGVKYLKDYMPSINADTLASKLKSSTNLSLKFDSKRTSSNLSNMNVLTGFQSVTSLDLSGTNLTDLRAVTYLTNLTSLDISDTKIAPTDLQLLAVLPNLKSLSVRNLSIKTLDTITKYLPNLESLDISGNDVGDISGLSALKKLKILKIAGIGIANKNLQGLKGLVTLTQLDVSNNDLSSSVVPTDSQLLAQLNLQSLNVSATHIPDAVLNDFFASVANQTPGLTEFIDRNKADMTKVTTCENINNIDTMYNLKKVTSLVNLDLHGNGCNVDGDANHDIGLTDTGYLVGMLSLATLDISDTAVSSLTGLQSLHHLKTVTVVDGDGGINMSREICLDSAQKFIQGVQINCVGLPSAGQATQSFTPGTYPWTVPQNVWQVTITGCSAANGASGSGGGGGGDSLHNIHNAGMGKQAGDSLGGTGGASGVANGNGARTSGSAGSLGYCNIRDLQTGRPIGGNTCGGGVQAGAGGNGGDAGVGGQTSFGSQKLSLAASGVIKDSNACFGGTSYGGSGGGAGAKAGDGGWGGTGGAGGSGAHGIDGWSSTKETHVVDVTPGDVVQITVGSGGAAGGAGGVGGAQCTDDPNFGGCGTNGGTGTAGTAGQDGTLTVTWQK